MARDRHAYTAYYRVSYWSEALPTVALAILVSFFLHRSPLHERLIVLAIVAGVYLLAGAFAARFERVLALRISSAGISGPGRGRPHRVTRRRIALCAPHPPHEPTKQVPGAHPDVAERLEMISVADRRLHR